MLTKLKLFPVLVLNLFDGDLNTNTTTDASTGNDLSGEMKTFYSNYLIRLAEPLLVHDQFGQKHPIPKNGGKTIEFRKWDSLPKQLTPLTEGVTPDGQNLNMSVLNATVAQYGGYVTLSDMLMLTAIDNTLMEATRLIADQAARTLDTITREVLAGGTNVQFAEGAKTSRASLVGGAQSGNDYLTVTAIRKAVRALKNQNARPLQGGDYVGIIHPDIAYDLMSDPNWVEWQKYTSPEHMYNNEIGKIAGVRFVETTEAKVFNAGPDLTAAARSLTVASYASKVITVDEAITAGEAAALAGRHIIVHDSTHDEVLTITSAAAGAAGAATITVKETPDNTPADGDNVYPGDGAAGGRDAYATLIIGADAYGVTEISGGGLQHIVKQLGSAGTADPLNQRATVGWKATKVAERLVEQYMVRIETASSFTS